MLRVIYLCLLVALPSAGLRLRLRLWSCWLRLEFWLVLSDGRRFSRTGCQEL